MVCPRSECGTQFGVVRYLRENGLNLRGTESGWHFV
ncbi:MAG: hypothetical protein QOE50_852, partial [Sphingomonadales bacterium]|nr:hypothetical protein [Sphingomonadales bacterium]